MLKNLKIKFILIVFTVTVSLTGFGQSIDSLKLDSLIHLLTLEKRDIETVNAYQALADEYINVMDYSIALTYADLAHDLSVEVGYPEGEIEAAMTSAHIYLAYYMNFKKALHYYDESYNLAIEHDFDDRLLPIFRGYSTLYASVDNYELALDFNEKAIKEAEKIGDEQIISDLNAYGGAMYEEKGDTAKALTLYEKVLEIETANNFMHSSKAALTSVAHYYYLTGEIEKSLDLYRSAIVKFERLHDYRWQAYAHAEIANVYLANAQVKRAEKHALRGLKISDEFELYKEKADNLFILTKIYRKVGDENSAQSYQSKYDRLMDSLSVDLSSPAANPTAEKVEVNQKAEFDYTNWINTMFILILVILVVVTSGFVMKSPN